MMDFITLITFVIGGGLLAYLIFSALAFLINTIRNISDKPLFKNYTLSSFSKATPSMLLDLDKQLHEMDFQVIPNQLGNFDTGVIQSLIDNKVVGKYSLKNLTEIGGMYSVEISDVNYGAYKNEYTVVENNEIKDIPVSISKLIFDEFISISGSQATTGDHPYFQDHRVEASEGICIANKKLVIKHNHVGDEKTDSGRTFKVLKGDILIPIKNIEDKFLSYLVINKMKAKNVRVASSITGGFFAIGKFPLSDNTYILCEDYLSGMTLHRATNKTVLVCFDVQNIKHVANSIMFKDNSSKLIFATAKDIYSKNQSRFKKGLLYANEYNMPFIFPVFPCGKQFEQYKTWNELSKFNNDSEIKQMVETQIDYFLRIGKDIAIRQVEEKYNILY
jgi:hypothetical protein